MYEVRHNVTPDGRDVYSEWYRKLRDVKAKIAVDRRINRIESGNFGDHKSLKRISGSYVSISDRVIGSNYAIAGTQIVLLLCGGDKGT